MVFGLYLIRRRKKIATLIGIGLILMGTYGLIASIISSYQISITIEFNSVKLTDKVLTYAAVRELLDRENRFDHCDNMTDIWRMTITLVKPLQLVYCPICKNMNTQMWALLTRTYFNQTFALDSQEGLKQFWSFRDQQPQSLEVVQDAFDYHIRELRTVDDFNYVVIIRHPFDRFLSAFHHICYTENFCRHPEANFCDKNLICMINHLLNLERNCLWNVYAVDLSMLHFVPQAYFCMLRRMRSNSVIFMHNDTQAFRQDLTKFMLNKGIPRKDIFEGWGSNQASWLNSTTSHRTANIYGPNKNAILQNVTILRQIFTIYQSDFQMFKFPMPKSVVQHCTKTDNYYDPLCKYFRNL